MSTEDPYLRDLEAERARVLRDMENLKAELRSIDRMIFRRRTSVYGDSIDQAVNSRNINKVFFESVIIEILKNDKRGLRTAEIYNRVKSQGYSINYNTLRSYIVKLRDDKKIYKVPRSYEWLAS